MPLTVENLCGLIIRSKLVPADEVKDLYRRWQSSTKPPKGTKEFMRWLIAGKKLTEYQCTLLANGYADNFYLSKYKILDRIGKGRMAGVYKAVHPSGQVVAIKVLPPSKAKDPHMLARFHREAQLAIQLKHPCVVQTFHCGNAGGVHYLVMECLEGVTLEAVLKDRGRLPMREAIRLTLQSAQGLQHVHEKGMVHRDLKPGNLMLTPAPKKGESTAKCAVKILDIGLGRALFDPKHREVSDELTQEGMILGTPDYLAPEQARDARKSDIRADLYSLGCSLYHMLSGQPPFPDQNPVRQVIRHANEQPKALKELGVEVPDELQQVVSKLLAKDPNQRFATPGHLVDVLRRLLGTDPELHRVRLEGVELKSFLEEVSKEQSLTVELEVVESANAPRPAGATQPGPSGGRPALPPSAEKLLAAKRRRRTKMDELVTAVPVDALEPAPVQPISKPVLPEADVVAVNLDELVRAPFNLPISRDLFMILSGALSVLGIVLFLWVLAWLFGSSAPVE